MRASLHVAFVFVGFSLFVRFVSLVVTNSSVAALVLGHGLEQALDHVFDLDPFALGVEVADQPMP